MKKSLQFMLFLLNIVFCFGCLCLPAAAASPESSGPHSALLSYNAAPGSEHPALVNTYEMDGESFLFLPSSADLSRLALSFSAGQATVVVDGRSLNIKNGEEFDLLSLFDSEPADGKYKAQFVINDIAHSVTVMRSAAIRSLYITSSDAEKDHAYVDAVKGNKAKGNEIVLLGADGESIYDGVMKEIKGRGNSTWHYPKKPYQFKLDEKADLLGAGESESSKTWILLANYYDGSLFRNRLTNDLAAALELNYTHNSEFVDLYYDGEYCGNYLLSEKTEIGKARIDINNLEGDIEDANGDVDFDELDTAIVTNSLGNSMQVVEGVALPEDISGGYLLEIDYKPRALTEVCWFETGHGQYLVCKSPEYLPAEAMEYVSGLYQDFEDAVYNGGIHPESGRDYTEYVDLESLAKSYLLLTLSQNGDAFLSSTFFYIPETDTKLYAGPVWDFDTAYGLYYNSDKHGMLTARSKLVAELLQIDSFRQAVAQQWNTYIRDIVGNTVLSTSAAAYDRGVSSIASYALQLSASREMDALRWNRSGTYSDSVDALYTFMAESYDWVENVFADPEKPWSTSGFVDVYGDSWYNEAVVYTTQKNYFAGTSDIMFSPSDPMTRAMLVTVLHRMAGYPGVENDCSYTDVPANSPYRKAIAWAETVGLTTGYGNDIFGTNDPITREQLVVFLHRYSIITGKELPSIPISDEFGDRDRVSPWAAEAFGWAIGEGIINGVSGDTPTLAPQDTATRAMTATIIYRYDNS